MNAVIQRKPIWQEIVDECKWERSRGRDPREYAGYVTDEDACRYIQECEESLVTTLADSICNLDREHEELERLIERIQNRGDSLPISDAQRLVDILQTAFTNEVRRRLAKRIDEAQL
jgi:hypothetical protein